MQDLGTNSPQPKESIETKLRACLQAEEEYVRFFLLSLDMLCIAGLDGYFKRLNPAFERILGWKINDLLAEPFLKFVHPEDQEATLTEMAKLSLGTQTIAFENRYRCCDGSYKWLLWNATPYLDQEMIYATARDITERKQFEQTLQESQERYSLAIQGSRDGLWDWNLLTNEVYYSPGFKEILGYEDSEIENHFSSFELRLHPDDHAVVLERIQAHLEKRVLYDIEYRLRTKLGDYRWICAKGQAIWDKTGHPTRMAGSICDVTDRKRGEQIILEQAALLDVATDAILVQGLDGQILFWNRGAEAIYGWKKDEVLTRKSQEILYEESLPEYKDILTAFTEKGRWQGELRHFNKAGKALTIESRWTLVRDQQGNPKSILVVNTDITEKKQIEMQFLRSQRIESIGTLASGIAHDLNNIFTPILAIAQLLLLKMSEADQQTQNYFEILQTSAKRGSALVSQILSFCQGIEGQRLELQVGHLIQEIRKIVNQTFPKSIQVQTEIPPNLWTVFGDPTQLHQVLMNLTVNARDAMPKGGVLRFWAQNLIIDDNYARINIEAKVGPYIVISVSDTGVGIPSEIVDRIFDPFFTTKEVGLGTGLGLATVLGIIKSHKGFIKVYSKVGEGSQFKIYLPAIGTEEN